MKRFLAVMMVLAVTMVFGGTAWAVDNPSDLFGNWEMTLSNFTLAQSGSKLLQDLPGDVVIALPFSLTTVTTYTSVPSGQYKVDGGDTSSWRIDSYTSTDTFSFTYTLFLPAGIAGITCYGFGDSQSIIGVGIVSLQPAGAKAETMVASGDCSLKRK